MGGTDRVCSMPYRVISALLACIIVAFGIALAAGMLEVRRPVKPAQSEPEATPKPYVQRVKSAESLLDNQNVRWVYRFAGGLPKCWVEIESEGHKQTLGPWVSVKNSGLVGDGPLNQPLLDSIEGYMALFEPKTKEQTYRLVCAITKVKYPENSKETIRVKGFRDPLVVTLPDLSPAPDRPKGKGPMEDAATSFSTFSDEEELRPVSTGQDVGINWYDESTPAGKRRSIHLMIRFFTPDEVSVAR